MGRVMSPWIIRPAITVPKYNPRDLNRSEISFSSTSCPAMRKQTPTGEIHTTQPVITYLHIFVIHVFINSHQYRCHTYHTQMSNNNHAIKVGVIFLISKLYYEFFKYLFCIKIDWSRPDISNFNRLSGHYWPHWFYCTLLYWILTIIASERATNMSSKGFPFSFRPPRVTPSTTEKATSPRMFVPSLNSPLTLQSFLCAVK